MTCKCPWCGEVCESSVELEVGQHVLCPSCGKKFTYHDPNGAKHGADTVRHNKDVPFVLKKYWPAIATALAALVVVLLFATELGRRIISNTFAFCLGGLFVFIIVFVIAALVALGWRVNKRALISIFDSLQELGEVDFHRLTKACIIIVFFLLGMFSCGFLFLLESLIVVVRANKPK